MARGRHNLKLVLLQAQIARNTGNMAGLCMAAGIALYEAIRQVCA